MHISASPKLLTLASTQLTRQTTAARFGNQSEDADVRALAFIAELDPMVSQGQVTWQGGASANGTYALQIGTKSYTYNTNAALITGGVGIPLVHTLTRNETGETLNYAGSGCFTGPTGNYAAESGAERQPLSYDALPRVISFFNQLTPPSNGGAGGGDGLLDSLSRLFGGLFG